MKIKLADYKKIATEIKKRKFEVSEKEIEESLNWLRKSRAKFSLKEKPAEKGDFIEIEYSSPQIENGKRYTDAFILGQGHFLENFEENLIGLKNFQEKKFTINNFKKNTLAQKLDFWVKVKSVQKMELPELSDDFARSLGNFENLDALKKSIKEGIYQEKKMAESQRWREEVLREIIANSQIEEIPQQWVEMEAKATLENLKKVVLEKLNISFAEFLKKIGQSEKQLLNSLLPEAKEKIREFLVLEEISKREAIDVSEEEIKEAVNNFLKNYPNLEKAKKELDLERLKRYYKEVIKNEKVFQFLENFSQEI